eukprot:TRINITY_DN21466_c0_g1_i3.p1 TRINITY_DN21466_c0_g1~~TRINITY_DN21466_c0_g1_i3.p1  ORF type:complete len:126 (-),score=9.45 TRINITY_DN21466_c0_g1_i3:265-642(-)
MLRSLVGSEMCIRDSSRSARCCLVYTFIIPVNSGGGDNSKSKYRPTLYDDYYPPTLPHTIQIFGDLTTIPHNFICQVSKITNIDMSRLGHVTVDQQAFLQGCGDLTTIDLSPFSQLTQIQARFLA